MSLEAELIYAATLRGMAWESVLDMELWQIAASFGLHRLETRAQRDQREITASKSEYWDETGEQRMERLAGYSERRKAQAADRKERKREEKANVR